MAFKGPKENRVRVRRLGVLTKDDVRTIKVDANLSGGKRLWIHWKCYQNLQRLLASARVEFPDLRAVSCLRAPKKISKDDWIEVIKAEDLKPTKSRPDGIRKYWFKSDETEARSIKRLAQFRAYHSGHETGLSVDFGSREQGLGTNSSLVSKYRKTQVYGWLVTNAATYGFTPYNKEPWHWEYHMNKAEWLKAPDGATVSVDAYVTRARSYSAVDRYSAYQSAKSPIAAFPPADVSIKYIKDTEKASGPLFNFSTRAWL